MSSKKTTPIYFEVGKNEEHEEVENRDGNSNLLNIGSSKIVHISSTESEEVKIDQEEENQLVSSEKVKLKKESTAPIITRDSTLSNINSFRAKPSPSRSVTHRQSQNVSINDEIDWYGNTCLHHLFAHSDTDVGLIEQAMREFPTFVSVANQFGRIPLHYAVDRGKVNVKGLELLLHTYPEGLKVQDNEGKTPYDLALPWDHSKSILLQLLNIYPDLDRAMYMKLKYGPIGSLAHWARSSFRNAITSKEETADETESNHDDTLLEEPTTCVTSANGLSRSGTVGDGTIFSAAIQRAQSRRFSADSIHSQNIEEAL